MSNRRKVKQKASAAVAGIASAARCSDCGATKATRRRVRGTWEVTLHHHPSCPALHGVVKNALHKDAEAAVKAVSPALAYRPDGETSGVVVGASGMVTGG